MRVGVCSRLDNEYYFNRYFNDGMVEGSNYDEISHKLRSVTAR